MNSAAGSLPRVGVLALQGDVREHLEALTAVGAEAVAVRRPAELASVDALVLPGGESTVIARLLRIFDLMEPLRTRIAAGMPVLGTCAGMILLANTIADPTVDGTGAEQESVGGIDVSVERNAFGRQVDSFETTLSVTGMGSTPVSVDAVFIRAPRVVSTGADVEVLAAVGDFPVAVRQGNLLATSFHPESAGVDAFHGWLVERAQAQAQAQAQMTVR